MATVNIVNCPIGIVRDTTGLPSLLDDNFVTGTTTSSGTAASIGFVAKDYGTNGGAWVITVSGNNVYVRFGVSPTATSQDVLILDGQTREFWARPGDTVSVIDAA